MTGGRLANTPIAVDYFRYQPSVRAYFMTHMHSDHNEGLSPSWNAGPIYCSPITRKLLLAKFNIKPALVKSLEVGETSMVTLKNDEVVNVTPLDANHCPGAVMFLFEGYFGTILHTGDFRYHPSMFDSGRLKKHVVDHLYIDNTFCHPVFQMPPREKALQQIIDIIEQHPQQRVFVGVDGLGKEDMLVALANHFKTLIVVSEERFVTLRLLDDIPIEVFTHQADDGFIHAWPRTKINYKQVKAWNKEEPTIAIIPTGWTYKPYSAQHQFSLPKKEAAQTNIKPKPLTPVSSPTHPHTSPTQDTQTAPINPSLSPSTQQPFSGYSSQIPSSPPASPLATGFKTLDPHQPESYEFKSQESQSLVGSAPVSPSNTLPHANSTTEPLSFHTNPTGLSTATPLQTTSFKTLEAHQPSFGSPQSSEFLTNPPLTPPSRSSSAPITPPQQIEQTQLITSFSQTPPTQSPPSTQGSPLDGHQPSFDAFAMEDTQEEEKEKVDGVDWGWGDEALESKEPKKGDDNEDEKEEESKEEIKQETANKEPTHEAPTVYTKRIFWVPYSLHSSYAELSEFVRRLRPRQISPLVDNKFYPRVHFDKYLDPTSGANYTINPVLLFNQRLATQAKSEKVEKDEKADKPLNSSTEFKPKPSSFIKASHPAAITPDSVPSPTKPEPKKNITSPPSTPTKTTQKDNSAKTTTNDKNNNNNSNNNNNNNNNKNNTNNTLNKNKDQISSPSKTSPKPTSPTTTTTTTTSKPTQDSSPSSPRKTRKHKLSLQGEGEEEGEDSGDSDFNLLEKQDTKRKVTEQKNAATLKKLLDQKTQKTTTKAQKSDKTDKAQGKSPKSVATSPKTKAKKPDIPSPASPQQTTTKGKGKGKAATSPSPQKKSPKNFGKKQKNDLKNYFEKVDATKRKREEESEDEEASNSGGEEENGNNEKAQKSKKTKPNENEESEKGKSKSKSPKKGEAEESTRQTRSKTREEVRQQNANFMASVVNKRANSKSST